MHDSHLSVRRRCLFLCRPFAPSHLSYNMQIERAVHWAHIASAKTHTQKNEIKRWGGPAAIHCGCAQPLWCDLSISTHNLQVSSLMVFPISGWLAGWLAHSDTCAHAPQILVDVKADWNIHNSVPAAHWRRLCMCVTGLRTSVWVCVCVCTSRWSWWWWRWYTFILRFPFAPPCGLPISSRLCYYLKMYGMYVCKMW